MTNTQMSTYLAQECAKENHIAVIAVEAPNVGCSVMIHEHFSMMASLALLESLNKHVDRLIKEEDAERRKASLN